MKVFVFSLVLLAYGTFGIASLGTPTGQPFKTLEESDVPISVYQNIVVHAVEPTAVPSTTLKLTGSGIRVKHVLVFSGKGYFATHYVENPSLIKKAEPWEGLQKNNLRMLSMVFLRDVGNEKILGSFKDGFEANKIPVETPEIQTVLKKLNYDMPKGKTLTLMSYRTSPSQQTLVVQGPDSTFSVTGAEIGDQFWKIWFGESADRGLADLKKDLLSLLP